MDVTPEEKPYGQRPIVDQLLRPTQRFFRLEAASSILLLAASALAVLWANSPFAEGYSHLWHTEISLFVGEWEITRSLVHWVNDGLMAIFFFTVGLEIKREVMVGDLSTPKMAMLPVVAALGGMIFPGIIYACFNFGEGAMAGWAIPMATDIAFAIGAIAVFGKRLPAGLRVFLAAFAIADDLGAVLIIAVFYSGGFVLNYVIAALAFVGLLFLANALWIRWVPLYVVLGLGTWVAVLGSGIHPTVAGVVVAMFIPARGRYNIGYFLKKAHGILDRYRYNRDLDNYWYAILLNQEHHHAVHSLEMACHDVETPLQRMEHALHPWVAFFILPVFAFGNAGLTLNGMPLLEAALHPVAMGSMLGLLIGKPIGITLFAWIAVWGGVAALPPGVSFRHIVGTGMLGGIGFTMSLFISGLSFADPALLNYSKLGVLSGSVLSACAGIAYLGIVCLRNR